MNCSHCTHDFPDALDRCPHCARPSLFPNVNQAEQAAEIAAVEQRYQDALAQAVGNGCGAVAQAFEAKAATAQAVIGRSIEEALRLAKADNQGYASFWDLLRAGVRIPIGDRWDRLRGLADVELFGTFRDAIRFAALSLDGTWLQHYGAVAFELKESMIAHRSTVFEENSAMYFERQRQQGNEPPIVAGYRARWSDRGKLALAKHAQDLTPTCTEADFPAILLRRGATSADDVFVEVYIYGSLTRRSLSRMIVDTTQVSKALVAELESCLASVAVQVEERG